MYPIMYLSRPGKVYCIAGATTQLIFARPTKGKQKLHLLRSSTKTFTNNVTSMLTVVASREETDYRFEIIVYMHRKFQMFEFPPFINVNKREKSVPSFFQIQIIN